MGVTLVAVVQALNAVATGAEMAAGERGVPWTNANLLVITGAVTAVVGLAVAHGLWRLHRGAWTATMLWVGWTMTTALLGYFNGHPSYVVMALSVLQVFYLNQSDVQRAFGRAARGPVEP